SQALPRRIKNFPFHRSRMALWVTTLPKHAFPTPVIRQLGHSRWKNENNGWMDLTKYWALISARLPSSPQTDQRLRRAAFGPQSWSSGSHPDSTDRVRIKFGV